MDEIKELVRGQGATSPIRSRSRIDASEGLTPDPPVASPTSHLFSIPKEIWRLVDFIYRFGLLDSELLFTSSGDAQTRAYLRECLDCGIEFDLCLLLQEEEEDSVEDISQGVKDISQGVKDLKTDGQESLKPRRLGRLSALSSACSTLLVYLSSLSEPVIPYSLYRRCTSEGTQSLSSAKQVLRSAPPLHYNLFIYLVSFLKELVGVRGSVAGHALHLGNVLDVWHGE
jgi:hypothetical protein